MELPRARPWMVLDRVLRVAGAQPQAEAEAGHGAGASMTVLVGMLARGEAQDADIDWDQVWLEQRVMSLDCYESAAAAEAAQAEAEAGHGAGASMTVLVGMLARGEAQDADIDLDQVWLEQRVMSLECYESAAAEAAQAALASDGHHFTVSVKAPPLITFLTAGISYPNPPAKPDRNPYIIATGPFCLLAQFSAEPPRDPAQFYYFNPRVSHLVVVRRFFGGADDQIGAHAELVPDRGDDMPKLLSRDVESVGFLCDDDDRSYLIAELKVTKGADSHHNAVLTCYRSVLRAWSRNLMDAPLPLEVDGNRNRPWVPHGALSLDSTVFWFDLSWGLLSLDFNLHKSEFRLDFSSLPADREMGPDEPTADIYDRRCITVSDKLLRYVEIIVSAGEAPTVSMWSRRRRAGVKGGWEWVLDFEESFDDIWNSQSYIGTGLLRNRPMLAFVNPVDSAEVYFTLRQHLFGVNLPERRVVYLEIIGRALRNNKHFLTWNLPKRGETGIGHVEPEQDAVHRP